jgi:hypothetical protein
MIFIMSSRERKKSEPQRGPIIDGDARPDQVDEKKISEKLKKGSEEQEDSKFSPNRASDVNSLEDYKDEK